MFLRQVHHVLMKVCKSDFSNLPCSVKSATPLWKCNPDFLNLYCSFVKSAMSLWKFVTNSDVSSLSCSVKSASALWKSLSNKQWWHGECFCIKSAISLWRSGTNNDFSMAQHARFVLQCQVYHIFVKVCQFKKKMMAWRTFLHRVRHFLCESLQQWLFNGTERWVCLAVSSPSLNSVLTSPTCLYGVIFQDEGVGSATRGHRECFFLRPSADVNAVTSACLSVATLSNRKHLTIKLGHTNCFWQERQVV